jgi:DNA excision repair protein ERCC-2
LILNIMDRVAVGTMVTRVLRSGDLRIEFSNARRARDGIRIHRRIQKSRPDNYEAEVPVSFTVKTAKAALEVSGRIDGVYINPGYCTI